MRYLIILALFLTSCSSSYHLKRAVAKDPDILRQDTLFIPEISIDTFYTLERDTIKISEDIDSIFTLYIHDDTCLETVKTVIPKIVDYIYKEEVIKDTLLFTETLTTDSLSITLMLQVWQEGQDIKLKSSLVKAQIYTTNVVMVDKSMFKLWQEIILLGVCILLLVFLIKK